MKRIKYIFVILLFINTFIFSSIIEKNNTNKNIIQKIIDNYKKLAMYNEGETFSISKIKIRHADFRYIGKLYIIEDRNRNDTKLMIYGYSNFFIYPIYNLETYNNYISTLSIFLQRSQIIDYFKFFLNLQSFYSNHKVYTEIKIPWLIEKYGRYGKKTFKEKLDNIFVTDPFLSYNALRDEYEVSIPTFTIINIDAYYRFRITSAIITSYGVFRKIWGKKSEYFIYNGEKARLSEKEIEIFEKDIY